MLNSLKSIKDKGTVTHLKENKETWQVNVVDPGTEEGLILTGKLEKSKCRGEYYCISIFIFYNCARA